MAAQPEPARAGGAAVTLPGPGDELLRAARERLCGQLLARGLPPAGFPAAYAAAADRRLQSLFATATKGKPRGYALLAVGGYGRHQLSPGSDLDLVLLHRGRRNYREVAAAIWYALWDEGLRLDHSVRTQGEAIAVAREDLKVVLGLLDARVVAGDEALGGRLQREVLELWQRGAGGLLQQLWEAVASRHQGAGELAFLLEPDLKQAAGGLRDLAALRAVRAAAPLAGSGEDPTALEAAEQLILATRAALHCVSGSSSDRLALQEQDRIAPLLGFTDADALMAALAEAGRTVAAGLEEAWHRTRQSLRGAGPHSGEQAVEPGVVVREGEVGLAEGADLRGDPSLTLRLARVAAQRHLLIERAALDRLAESAHPPPEPWSEEVRGAFVSLLSTGDALVPVVESLDRRRLLELYLPEWRAVRNRPQRNAYHRFTVDRHLLEAVALTAPHLGDVDRPDLLVLGALLHDLGKGFPGDHSEVGRELAERFGRRMGLPAGDQEVLARLVAFHLLLPEFATRRDLDDPATAQVVARLVGNRRTLTLLAALAEADGRATGTAAWSPWKAELVTSLVARVGDVLDGRPLPAPAAPAPPASLAGAMAAGRLGVAASGRRLTVVAPDRLGLLAAVSGVLALHGCNVLRASAGAGDGRMAVESYDVEFTFGRPPDWERVEADVVAALEGRLSLGERLAAQERTYARGRRPGAAAPDRASVRVDERTSELATIVEVQAPDRLGLLHRVADALASAEVDVVAALVDTLGHVVVDAFYVRDREGRKLGAVPGRVEGLRTLLYEVLTRA